MYVTIRRGELIDVQVEDFTAGEEPFFVDIDLRMEHGKVTVRLDNLDAVIQIADSLKRQALELKAQSKSKTS